MLRPQRWRQQEYKQPRQSSCWVESCRQSSVLFYRPFSAAVGQIGFQLLLLASGRLGSIRHVTRVRGASIRNGRHRLAGRWRIGVDRRLRFRIILLHGLVVIPARNCRKARHQDQAGGPGGKSVCIRHIASLKCTFAAKACAAIIKKPAAGTDEAS
jgi:hypothetical protein